MRHPFPLLATLLPTLAAAACARAPAPPPAPEPAAVAFTHVAVLPMTGDTVLRDATVVVRGGRIAAVGPAGRTPVPAGARTVDGRGRWLMPGLVDAHFHLTSHAPTNQALLALALANGVTTVVSLGGDSVVLRQKRDAAEGRLPAPTIYSAGPNPDDSTLTYAGGVRLAEEQHAAGYDLIKVYNRLSRAGYRGIMKRAGELGIPVVGHVVRSVDLEGTLGSGQRGIVHMEEYLYTYFGYRISDTTGTHPARLDTTAIPYLARATAAAGVWVTPTLVTFEGILEQAEDLERALARPEVAYVPAALFDATWAPGRNRYTRFATPVHRANLRAALAYQRRMLRAFHEAGVGLLVGTDAPVPAVVPGFAVHDELANFVEAGLPPYAALRAATRSAAEYLGRDDFGTVEPGKRADLLLLDADPRAGVAAAARPAGVMVRGEWLDRARLDALLPERRAESPPR